MAFKKYLNCHKRGYVTVVFLIVSMIVIIQILAVTFRQLMKFYDLSEIVIQQKNEEIAALKGTNISAELLSSPGIRSFLLEGALVNPHSSSELLVYINSEIIGKNTLSTEIYSMNYTISSDIDLSDESIISDVHNYPPSRKTIAGERYFLIKTTLNKNEAPSFCKETAFEITVSGNTNELWHREYVIY